ncbi:MAG: hypothetical protein KUG81_10220, partial [Gammaproteobacteria bacterium]|nr:hypothetical protein [Gammaproteobacteria bacterium]
VYSGIAQTDTFQYVGLDAITASKVDTGDGVTWVTLVIDTSVGVVSNISFDISENTSGASRSMQIQMVDGINDPTYTLTQNSKTITFDNNTVTFDSDTITWDNG